MFRQAFDWLLNKGLAGATLIINLIFYIVLAVVLLVLRWYHNNH